MDSLDEKLARISGRMSARRDEARRIFETHPELSHLREIKARFDGKVEYVAAPGFTWGTDHRGVVVRPYRAPQTSRRGKAKAMRKRENERG